jgi:hypothetical protein
MTYFNKYLKYKKKYINLKNQIGGINLYGVVEVKTKFEQFELKENLNSNIVKINYNGANLNILISTGHSVNYESVLLNGETYIKNESLMDVLTNNLYFKTFVDSDKRDLCIFKSNTINGSDMIIKMDESTNYQLNGILRNVEPGVRYFKRGATTGITYGDMILNLNNSPTVEIREIQNEKYLKYQLSVDEFLLINTLTNKFTNIEDIGDYILKPSLKNYESVREDQDIRETFGAILKDFKYFFSTSEKIKDIKNIYDLHSKKNIANQYYDDKCFGWVSKQGDSGSGYYKIEGNSAKLLGLNLQGCSAIILRNISEYNEDEDFVYDTELNKLKIQNYVIEKIYKCVVILGINSIENYMKQDVGINRLDFVDNY